MAFRTEKFFILIVWQERVSRPAGPHARLGSLGPEWGRITRHSGKAPIHWHRREGAFKGLLAPKGAGLTT